MRLVSKSTFYHDVGHVAVICMSLIKNSGSMQPHGDIKMNEIELVFPTKAHEADAKEYFEEHILIGENSLHGDSGLDNAESYDKWLEKINDALTREIHSIIFFAIRESVLPR